MKTKSFASEIILFINFNCTKFGENSEQYDMKY